MNFLGLLDAAPYIPVSLAGKVIVPGETIVHPYLGMKLEVSSPEPYQLQITYQALQNASLVFWYQMGEGSVIPLEAEWKIVGDGGSSDGQSSEWRFEHSSFTGRVMSNLTTKGRSPEIVPNGIWGGIPPDGDGARFALADAIEWASTQSPEVDAFFEDHAPWFLETGVLDQRHVGSISYERIWELSFRGTGADMELSVSQLVPALEDSSGVGAYFLNDASIDPSNRRLQANPYPMDFITLAQVEVSCAEALDNLDADGVLQVGYLDSAGHSIVTLDGLPIVFAEYSCGNSLWFSPQAWDAGSGFRLRSSLGGTP